MNTQNDTLTGHEDAIERAVNKENQAGIQENKNIRQSTHIEARQVEKEGRMRLPLSRENEFDYLSKLYAAKYPDDQLFWVNDWEPNFHQWRDRDADLIPSETRGKKEWEGVTTGKGIGTWVCLMGTATIDGNPGTTYLMKIDPDLYDYYKLAPDRDRNEAIQASLHGGGASKGARDSGNELQTYSPNLPTGGDETGYAEKKTIE